jgi:WD40 repeat protein
MKIFALPLVLLGLLVPLVHADQTRTSEKPETWLFVRTTPPEAQVFLDGKQLGTSTDLFPVQSGVHKLVVKLEGHQPQTQTVTIPAGEVTRVVLKLKKRPKTGGSNAVPERPAPDSASPDDKDAVAAIKKLGAELKLRSDATVSSLSFEGTQVADADLALLRKLARLHGLDLSGTQISDAGLAHLKDLPHLERLGLNDTQVTVDGVKRLKQARPNLQIFHNEYPGPGQPGFDVAEGTARMVDLQVRLGADKRAWKVGEIPTFQVDVCNGAKDKLYDTFGRRVIHHLRFDGRWYRNSDSVRKRQLVLPPGEELNRLGISLRPELWHREGTPNTPQLTPGKHVVWVAFVGTLGAGSERDGGKPVRAVSNAVEIEILPAETTAEAVPSGEPKLLPRKLFSARHGAGAGILAVAFSPDGLRVAAVDEQGKVMLCAADSGGQLWGRPVLTPEEKKLLLYEERQGRIHTAAIAFSHDGYTLAVAADPVVRLYDAQSGRLLRALEDKQLVEQIKALKRPPATVSRELELLKAVPHAHGRVYSVAFSPDGTLLATSGSHLIRADGSSVINAENATPGKLKLWDVKTGELKRDLGEHTGPLRSVAFSPDGKTLAMIGTHPPSWTSSVRLWDPQTGAVKSVLPIAHGGISWSVALSPDGELVAACALVSESNPGDPGGLQRLGRVCKLLVWNARTGALLRSRPVPGLASLSFSADSQTLATGVDGRGVTLWDPQTLEMKGEIAQPTDLPRDLKGTVCVAFSPIGSLLAVGAEDAKQGGFLTVWDLGQGDDRPTPPAERAFLTVAKGRGEHCVLDLASGQMLPMSEEALRDLGVFTRIGKGDLMYDDMIHCLRGAQVKCLDEADLRASKGKRYQDVTSIAPSTIPCRMRITTAEGKQFDVTILPPRSPRDKGWHLEYRPAEPPAGTE